MNRPTVSAWQLAKRWEAWCGGTAWSKAMREWAELGGRVIDYGGVPLSASAIPLCFVLVDSSGQEMPGSSRLKDIRAAVKEFNR
ncbi:hypothetical protein LCGC14_2555650 [marine sediment metagenome]|uniref:Uncharacterized protein n=1 Tax=marine sediment metagenome TaxID=412755 RepID=A0A0F9AM34_9ZZZZ